MKRFFKRHWPLLAIGIFILIISLSALRSGLNLDDEEPSDHSPAQEGLLLRDVHYAQDDQGRGLQWILDAGDVRVSSDKNNIAFNRFSLKVDKKDKTSFVLKGDRGDYSRETGVINLWGNVQGSSKQGYQVVSEHFLINDKEGFIRTERAVSLKGPFFVVSGNGLFIDLETEDLKIFSDVHALVDENRVNL